MLDRSLIIVALLSATACSPARPAVNASTDVTSSDEPRTSESAEPEPVTMTTPTSATEHPPRDLVCRTSTTTGRTELFLTWSGDEATGVLRSVGRSGEITDARVRAERHKSMVIVDTPGSNDLVDHLAVVFDDHGKRRMRSTDMGPARVSDCE
jgi:hypothetical protein